MGVQWVCDAKVGKSGGNNFLAMSYFEYREFVILRLAGRLWRPSIRNNTARVISSVAKEPGLSPENGNHISTLSFGTTPRVLRYAQDDKPTVFKICIDEARRYQEMKGADHRLFDVAK